MTIVRKFGKPDLFITFTCNPLWDEITGSLLLNQKATDRPDLIVRVFRQKLRKNSMTFLRNMFLVNPLGTFIQLNFRSVVFRMLTFWLS